MTEDLITYKLKMTNGDIVHLHQVGMFIDQYGDTNYENDDTFYYGGTRMTPMFTNLNCL